MRQQKKRKEKKRKAKKRKKSERKKRKEKYVMRYSCMFGICLRGICWAIYCFRYFFIYILIICLICYILLYCIRLFSVGLGVFFRAFRCALSTRMSGSMTDSLNRLTFRYLMMLAGCACDGKGHLGSVTFMRETVNSSRIWLDFWTRNLFWFDFRYFTSASALLLWFKYFWLGIYSQIAALFYETWLVVFL